MTDARSVDRLLALRIADGDGEACARLVREHHAHVYRMLAGLCRDGHWAEDLTQETFAACWRAADGFDGRASLGVWLRRIAYHKFIDWQRSRQRDPAAALSGATAAEATDHADPAERLLSDEVMRNVHAALAALPQDERAVIVLHYLEGLSLQDTAYVLDQPAGTVKWRVSKALAALRERLADAEG